MRQPQTRSEDVRIPVPENDPRRKAENTRNILLGGGGVVAVLVLLLIVLRVTLHNPGSGNEVGQNQVTLSTASGYETSSTPRPTNKCVVHEMMKTFSGSEDYCRSRNSRLLNEQDTKTSAQCISRGEDFWVAPVSRNPSECFIYNTDHGFVLMDCRTLRWFICLET